MVCGLWIVIRCDMSLLCNVKLVSYDVMWIYVIKCGDDCVWPLGK